METISLYPSNGRALKFAGEVVASYSSSFNSAASDYSGMVGVRTDLTVYKSSRRWYVEYCTYTQWIGEKDTTVVTSCRTIEEVLQALDGRVGEESVIRKMDLTVSEEDHDGARFVAMRAETGLTQQDAANMLNVSMRTVQRWENGECPIHPAYFELLRVKTAA